jgi:hypothetical protein
MVMTAPTATMVVITANITTSVRSWNVVIVLSAVQCYPRVIAAVQTTAVPRVKSSISVLPYYKTYYQTLKRYECHVLYQLQERKLPFPEKWFAE